LQQGSHETEVKFFIARLSELERHLLGLHPRLVQARTHELNLRFDTAQGDFTQAGRVLRLRQDSAVRLTYKGPAQIKSGASDRLEIEFTVSDFASAKDLLLGLDYQVVFIYEKYRTTYALEGVEVMLDELPYGDFVEIEGEFTALRPAAERLGLNWAATVPRSYHDLFQQLRTRRDLPFRDLTFDNFAGVTLTPADLGLRPADS
jgi:adenylate cyclase class 2